MNSHLSFCWGASMNKTTHSSFLKQRAVSQGMQEIVPREQLDPRRRIAPEGPPSDYRELAELPPAFHRFRLRLSGVEVDSTISGIDPTATPRSRSSSRSYATASSSVTLQMHCREIAVVLTPPVSGIGTR